MLQAPRKVTNYRPDIDGLRALAVFAVVIFHAYPEFVLRGGFIGVDIFFVISGFLITQNILQQLSCGTFSFLGFYTSRVRRIFPALLLVCATAFGVGVVAMPFEPLLHLKKEILAGLSFYANILFWNEVGYFDASAETKPLLHLWSLGVEEQFYAVWPLFLWALFKWRREPFLPTLLVTAASLVVSLVTSRHHSLDAFYLPQGRIWQLGAGALLAMAQTDRSDRPGSRSLLAPIGAALLGISLWAITPDQDYPGWRAILPTAGTLLLISAGEDAWLNRRLLSTPVVVFVGLISYPLYLWHWPALVLARQLADGEPSAMARPLALAASLALSVATYWFVERPIRFGRSARAAWNVGLPAATIGLASLAYLISPTVGYRSLTPEQARLIAQLHQASRIREQHNSDLYGAKPCFKTRLDQTIAFFVQNGCLDVPKPDRKTVFLIGDSHSASLSLGMRPYLERFDVNLLQVSTGWCEPTSNNPDDKTCREINQAVDAALQSVKPELVVVDMSYLQAQSPRYYQGRSGFYRHVLSYISDLKDLGAKHIVVVGQIPAWTSSLPNLLIETFVKKGRPIPDHTFEGLELQSLAIDDIMRSLKYPPDVLYVSLADALCNQSGCLTSVGPDYSKDVIVWDDEHLTTNGAKRVVELAFAQVGALLAR